MKLVALRLGRGRDHGRDVLMTVLVSHAWSPDDGRGRESPRTTAGVAAKRGELCNVRTLGFVLTRGVIGVSVVLLFQR